LNDTANELDTESDAVKPRQGVLESDVEPRQGVLVAKAGKYDHQFEEARSENHWGF